MPYADPAARAACWRARDQRRRQAMRDYLGGVCVVCGTTEDLEIDHIDRTLKSFDPNRHPGKRWSELTAELDKCQLLCQAHHLEKGRAAGDVHEAQHGTHSRYVLGCREQCCITADRAYHTRQKQLKRGADTHPCPQCGRSFMLDLRQDGVTKLWWHKPCGTVPWEGP